MGKYFKILDFWSSLNLLDLLVLLNLFGLMFKLVVVEDIWIGYESLTLMSSPDNGLLCIGFCTIGLFFSFYLPTESSFGDFYFWIGDLFCWSFENYGLEGELYKI